ncbi:hypothetical protein [Natrinema gelatinilyticum]|nr:hypothetical protein [Natrinema gelatinilyticum]
MSVDTNDADRKRDVGDTVGAATEDYLDGDVLKRGADLECLVG